MPRFPGIAFRGDDARRRPWLIGTGLDIWETVQMFEDFGSLERLVENTQLGGRQVRVALAYRDAYPEEIAAAIDENRLSTTAWRELYPFIELPATPSPPVRLLLDANLSARGIATPLQTAGHDVLALAAERRVLITHNSRDFAPLAREWAEAPRHHTGLILIWTLDHSQFAAIVTGIERYLELWPEQRQWHDLVVAQ